MPRGDKTGPNGNGPRSGRGLGYCNGNNQPGYLNDNNFSGRGRGFGFRHRVGGRRFVNNIEVETDYLNNNADVSEKTLIINQINILKDKLSTLEEKLKKLN